MVTAKLECYRGEIHKSPPQFSYLCVTSKHLDDVTVKASVSQPHSQGPFSTLRKYPGCGWSRVYAWQPKPHRGWVLNLILSTSSREFNVELLYGRYFEKEASYLSEILPGQLLRLYLNFCKYEMLIETKLCSYFTAFLNNGQQPASD